MMDIEMIMSERVHGDDDEEILMDVVVSISDPWKCMQGLLPSPVSPSPPEVRQRELRMRREKSAGNQAYWINNLYPSST